jgi:hypothetical protein
MGKATIIASVLKCLIRSDPLRSCKQMVAAIRDGTGVTVSKELIRCVLKKEGFTRKKARFFGRPKDLPDKVRVFVEARDALMRQHRPIYSLDETSFGRHRGPCFGFAPRGEQLRLPLGSPRCTTTSVVALADCNGIVARQACQGSFNTVRFVAFLEKLDIPPKSVVLLDNVAFHKASAVKTLANAREWQLLFVPRTLRGSTLSRGSFP